MAKKRVHELAKQYNMPTAEVMKRLNAAGIAVKATASAVDENEADADAFTSMPAAFSRFITSAEGMLYCLASSWTRFLAMSE